MHPIVVMRLPRLPKLFPTLDARVSRIVPFFVLTLLALPALWPLYVVILPQTGDGNLHLMRLTVLDRYLDQGIFYPRWASELALGFGHPVFNYYAPASYAVIELLHGLGIPHVRGYALTIALYILIAGPGMYRLAYDFYRDYFSYDDLAGDVSNNRNRNIPLWLAMVAATTYIYAPYFLTTAHFRGAIAETGAQALLPWIWWSFRRLSTHPQPSHYLLPATLSLGGLAVMHNITLLFTPILLLGYMGALWLTNLQSTGYQWRRLFWLATACLGAMGISAFFWLPMAIERNYLSNFSYHVSTLLVPHHTWTWSNFIDWHLRFAYTEQAPFQLGLIQALLALIAIIGAFLRKGKQRWEWWYWFVLTLVMLMGITAVAEPLWLNNQYLLITQFPWRLLTFVSLSFALFIGALVGYLHSPRLHRFGAIVLIGIIIVANRPTITDLTTMPAFDLDLSLPAVNHYELDSGAYGASLGREFMPSATDDFVIQPVPASGKLGDDVTVALQSANAHVINLLVNTTTTWKLRFTNFFFPGWQVTLNPQADQPQHLTLYASTQQAVATVDVPAGQYQVEFAWKGTALQRLGTYLSLISLLVLTIYVGRYASPSTVVRYSAFIPGVLFCYSAWAMMKPPPAPQAPMTTVTQTIAPGLELLGYYTEQAQPHQLYIWPYWFVKQSQPDLTLRWSLVDDDGEIRSETVAYPYFNTQRSAGWSAGMVVDDAYQLTLPPELPAGQYTLEVEPLAVGQGTVAEAQAQVVGPVDLVAVPPAPTIAMQSVGLRFADEAILDGYAVKHNRQPILNVPSLTDTEPSSLVVMPTDLIELTLFWRAQRPILYNFHSFVHLLDHRQQSLLQQDQLPGPFGSAPMLWSREYPLPDIYRFNIPNDAPSGLYYPHVGLYAFADQDFSEQERLSVFTEQGELIGNGVNLPPIKVFNPDQPTMIDGALVSIDATFPTLATIAGYQRQPNRATLMSGESLTLTLVYQSLGAAPLNYTQFVQLYHPEFGIAGQIDQDPLQGGNPTTTWVAGETIVETVTFQIKSDAPPGQYYLQVGLYDRQTGQRYPVLTEDGRPLPNRQIVLTEVRVITENLGPTGSHTDSNHARQ